MAWFGEGMSSLSNLKGQLTSFTKEVLSDSIIQETDERAKELSEANERCVQLQELLNSKDAEISLLRRQNCELQKTVVEFNSKSKDTSDTNQDEEDGAFFWDPPSTKNRRSKNQNRMLHEHLAQATMRIRELESELKCVQKVNNSSLKDEVSDGHQSAEFLRAKQDMLNHMIQLEEKTREASLVSDFRAATSKLNSLEKLDLVRSALKALENESENCSQANGAEKFDDDENQKSLAAPSHESDYRNSNGAVADTESNKQSDLKKKIEVLQEENQKLIANMEELDQCHNESMNELLTMKEQLDKKHANLQSAYEQLYVDFNEAQAKITELTENAKIAQVEKSVEINATSQSIRPADVQTEEREVQTDSMEEVSQSSSKTGEEVLDELNSNIKQILKNSCIDVEPGESIFVALAKQYVDAKWKKEMLERRVTELTREWKETVEMKNTLQVECDDMQTHIDGLILEVQDLKLNLPSIPEASEERVASLESETESLQEEVKRLQDEKKAIQEECSRLRMTVQNLEASFQSQEMPNVKISTEQEPLDVSDNDLTKNDDSIQDLRSKLQASLDENRELREQLESLKTSAMQMKKELELSSEKCNRWEEYMNILDDLKVRLTRSENHLPITDDTKIEAEASLIEPRAEHLIQADDEFNARISLVLEKLYNKERTREQADHDELLTVQEQELKFTLAENKKLRHQLKLLHEKKDDLQEQLIVIENKSESQVVSLKNEISRLQALCQDSASVVSHNQQHSEAEAEEFHIDRPTQQEGKESEAAVKEQREGDKQNLLPISDDTKIGADQTDRDELLSAQAQKLKFTLDQNEDLNHQLNLLHKEKDDLQVQLSAVQSTLERKIVEDESKQAEHHNQTLNDQSEIEARDRQISLLTQEKDGLLEQFATAQKESEEKIDLLNTELSLLQQECYELRETGITKEKDLDEFKKEWDDIADQNEALQGNLDAMTIKITELEEQNETLLKEKQLSEEEKRTLQDVENLVTEKMNSLQSEYARMKSEMEAFTSKQADLFMLQQNLVTLKDQNVHLTSLLQEREEDYQDLQAKVAHLQAEKADFLNNANESAQHVDLTEILEEKLREIESLTDNNTVLMNEINELNSELQRTLESSKESADMAKQTTENLSLLIKEKDVRIKFLESSLSGQGHIPDSEEFTKIKNERDELVTLVTHKHTESVYYHSEVQRLTQLLNDQAASINNINSLILKQQENARIINEKDRELLWTRNELQVLQQRLKQIEEVQGNPEICNIVAHSAQANQFSILNEKCNALEAALIQEQSNTRMLQNQLNESQSKEANARKELERLRSHLVEIESSYTEEALIAEDTRKKLEAKLLHAEEKIKNNATVYTSANIRANQQVETLQQQIALIIQQRDEIQNKLFAAEDKILSQTASLTNLQIVLEQFQSDKEKDISTATERIRGRLNESYKHQEQLKNEITNLKEQLSEAKECLLAASRLSEQLDKKSERIEQLSQEVDRLTQLVNTSEQRIEEAKQSEESKVDKTLIKNLFLGYLTSSAADKSSVLRVFATLLDFNESEREKAGLINTGASNSWFSRTSGGSSYSNKDQEASLSAAFVRFLESESKPKPQLPALPIQTTPLSRPGHSRQHSTSSTQSALLLSSVNLPTFPDFIPARNTGSILKEVLKDS